MIMDLTAQIPDVTVGRAANAPHYEYMTTFGKRTAELPVDHESLHNEKRLRNHAGGISDAGINGGRLR